VEPTHLVRRAFDRPAQPRVQVVERRVEHRVGDDEPVGDVHAVEAGGQPHERVVTVGGDGRDAVEHPRTGRLEVDAWARHPVAGVAPVASEVEDPQT